MAFRLEWRSRSEGDDTILAVEEGTEAVVKTWVADTDRLRDFLNDMENLDRDYEGKSGNGFDPIHRKPPEFGELVMSRSVEGDVLWLDPQRYWDGIAHWFRSKGMDPHPYHGKR